MRDTAGPDGRVLVDAEPDQVSGTEMLVRSSTSMTASA
jgi:hypothetical protein